MWQYIDQGGTGHAVLDQGGWPRGARSGRHRPPGARSGRPATRCSIRETGHAVLKRHCGWVVRALVTGTEVSGLKPVCVRDSAENSPGHPVVSGYLTLFRGREGERRRRRSGAPSVTPPPVQVSSFTATSRTTFRAMRRPLALCSWGYQFTKLQYGDWRKVRSEGAYCSVRGGERWGESQPRSFQSTSSHLSVEKFIFQKPDEGVKV